MQSKSSQTNKAAILKDKFKIIREKGVSSSYFGKQQSTLMEQAKISPVNDVRVPHFHRKNFTVEAQASPAININCDSKI
jgi:hypothetical protein